MVVHGVRQRGPALRLQLRHHGVGGAVALAVRLDDVPGRRRRRATTRTWAPTRLVSRLPLHGKKICLLVGHLLMLFVCWLVFKGAWQQVKINWASTSAVMEVSMASSTAAAWCSPCWAPSCCCTTV
jgi:hypothetical protein